MEALCVWGEGGGQGESLEGGKAKFFDLIGLFKQSLRQDTGGIDCGVCLEPQLPIV